MREKIRKSLFIDCKERKIEREMIEGERERCREKKRILTCSLDGYVYQILSFLSLNTFPLLDEKQGDRETEKGKNNFLSWLLQFH